MKRLLATLAIATLAACGGDSSTTNPLVAIAGTYTLQTVNGKPLPTTVQVSATISTTFVAEEITILVGNRWVGARTGSTQIDGQVISTSGARFGEWALEDGSTLHLMDTTQLGPSFRDGTWSGNTITLTDPPYTWVYTRTR